MQRAARDPKEPILTRVLLWRTIYVSTLMVIGAYALFTWELRNGMELAVARTTVANVVVLVELVYLFNCRSLTLPVTRLGFFTNHWVILGALIMLGLQMLFVYVPIMNMLFETAPVPLVSWLKAGLIALVVFAIVELEKWIRRRRDSAAQAPQPG